MKESEIIDFVKDKIKPLHDFAYKSPVYRCSANLTDGLYLPCVTIQSRQAYVDLAIRRFKECRDAASGVLKRLMLRTKPANSINDYRTIVGTFVCGGNSINYYDIKNLAESPFAIPPERMAEIIGETYMNWTQFTARMKDGRQFQFGTTYSMEFFDMPDGYTAGDIVKIISATRGTPPNFQEKVFREKPFFVCYIEGL